MKVFDSQGREKVAAGGAGDGLNRISASNQLAGTMATVVFSNSNNVTFGMTNSSIVTASVQSAITVSDSATSLSISRLAFTNSNGLTMTLSTGAGAATVIGSYTVPTVTNSSWTVSDNATSGTVARLAFTNLNGVTLSLSSGTGGSHTIVGSHNALTSQSNQNVTAGNGGFAFQTLSFSNLNGISFGTSAGSAITASHNALTTARASNDAIGLNTAQTNVTWTVNSSGLSLNAAGYAGTGTSATNASITLNSNGLAISVAAPGGAAITQSIGISTQTAGGSTAGTSGYATGDDILYHFVPGSNVTMSQSLNGASATLSVYGAAPLSAGMSNLGSTSGTSGLVASQIVFVGTNGLLLSQSVNGQSATLTFDDQQQTISSFQNLHLLANSSLLTLGLTSLSHAVAFQLPQAGSFSFLRIPVSMSTNSTTIATLASATATASGGISHTFNAVIYSMGTGANSRSLQSVVSGSAGMTFSQQISITNSTQYSISLGVTANANGGAANTNRTTQYSISNTNYSFTTNQIATEWSSARFLDIPFANSLPYGPYWLVFGGSSSSQTGGAAGLAALTNCHVRYGGHFGASNINQGFGIMGSTDLASGGQLGNGFFSTAGGGTTNSIPISAISSTSSNPVLMFMLLRSA